MNRVRSLLDNRSMYLLPALFFGTHIHSYPLFGHNLGWSSDSNTSSIQEDWQLHMSHHIFQHRVAGKLVLGLWWLPSSQYSSSFPSHCHLTSCFLEPRTPWTPRTPSRTRTTNHMTIIIINIHQLELATVGCAHDPIHKHWCRCWYWYHCTRNQYSIVLTIQFTNTAGAGTPHKESPVTSTRHKLQFNKNKTVSSTPIWLIHLTLVNTCCIGSAG